METHDDFPTLPKPKLETTDQRVLRGLGQGGKDGIIPGAICGLFVMILFSYREPYYVGLFWALGGALFGACVGVLVGAVLGALVAAKGEVLDQMVFGATVGALSGALLPVLVLEPITAMNREAIDASMIANAPKGSEAAAAGYWKKTRLTEWLDEKAKTSRLELLLIEAGVGLLVGVLSGFVAGAVREILFPSPTRRPRAT